MLTRREASYLPNASTVRRVYQCQHDIGSYDSMVPALRLRSVARMIARTGRCAAGAALTECNFHNADANGASALCVGLLGQLGADCVVCACCMHPPLSGPQSSASPSGALRRCGSFTLLGRKDAYMARRLDSRHHHRHHHRHQAEEGRPHAFQSAFNVGTS